MNIFKHSSCHGVLLPPVGMTDCAALPITRSMLQGVHVTQSFWKPDADELQALNEGRAVVLTVLGNVHLPVNLAVAATD